MPPLGKLAFLIVDDNRRMSQLIREVLISFGVVNVYDAPGVVEAFAVVQKTPIDIALVDYNLGFLDGVEFVRMIRTSPESPNPYLPIIMVTAYSDLTRVFTARDAGANEFCTKPITPIQLYRRIAEVIERPRPFVRTATYFGPDRRRREDANYAGPERRVTPPSFAEPQLEAAETG